MIGETKAGSSLLSNCGESIRVEDGGGGGDAMLRRRLVYPPGRPVIPQIIFCIVHAADRLKGITTLLGLLLLPTRAGGMRWRGGVSRA